VKHSGGTWSRIPRPNVFLIVFIGHTCITTKNTFWSGDPWPSASERFTPYHYDHNTTNILNCENGFNRFPNEYAHVSIWITMSLDLKFHTMKSCHSSKQFIVRFPFVCFSIFRVKISLKMIQTEEEKNRYKNLHILQNILPHQMILQLLFQEVDF